MENLPPLVNERLAPMARHMRQTRANGARRFSTIDGVTDEERQEVQRLIEAHEHTVAVCRACAETTRDLAWEVKRGAAPPADALTQTITEADRVLAELGQVELAIARMKASLW